MSWARFAAEAPDLAGTARRLFEGAGVVLVGTVRSDGSPRISPVEPIITDGELYLGMMPDSFKARDLERDPRCTIHNAVADRTGGDGEFKLHGRVRPVTDPEERDRYGDALYEVIGWKPEGEFPLFAVDIETAALFITGETARTVTRWRAGGPVTTFEQT